MFVIESDDLSQVPVQLKPIILQDNNKSSLSSGFVSELSLHSLSNNSFGCSMPSIRISSDSLLELDYFNDALDSSKRVYTSDSELSSTSGKFSLSRRLVKETQRIECLTASNLASDTYSSLNSSSDIVFGKTMINEYAIIKDIGHGTFSTVRLLYNTLDGKYYAGKCVSKKRMKKLGMLKKGPVRKKKFQDGKNGQDEIENLYNINKIKEENNKQVDVSFEDKSIAYNKSEKDKLDLGRKEINLGPPDEIKSQIYESNKPNDGENQTTSVDKKTGEKHGISDQNISNKNKGNINSLIIDTTVCQTLTKEIVLKKVESRDFMDLVRREIAILKKLSLHPNVASLLEVLDDESHDSLYMSKNITFVLYF